MWIHTPTVGQGGPRKHHRLFSLITFVASAPLSAHTIVTHYIHSDVPMQAAPLLCYRLFSPGASPAPLHKAQERHTCMRYAASIAHHEMSRDQGQSSLTSARQALVQSLHPTQFQSSILLKTLYRTMYHVKTMFQLRNQMSPHDET